MADDFDLLTSALRRVARDDAVEAGRRLSGVEARLAAEVRRLGAAPSGGQLARGVGLAMAAALLLAVGASLWVVGRGVPDATRKGPPASEEIRTAFMPLVYSAIPFTDARVVRIEVPRRALVTFGLAPIDALDTEGTDTVIADVLVAEDGLARAVRFVRAPRASGVQR
jgi:hypothetical protein